MRLSMYANKIQMPKLYNAEEIENNMQQIETQFPTHYVLMQKPIPMECNQFDLSIDKNNMLKFLKDNKSGIVVRTYYDSKNEPWFVAKDVATILEYSDPKGTVRDNVRRKYKSTIGKVKEGTGAPPLANEQKTTILINESGLYELVMKSKKPVAVDFQDWVLSDVLPSIRKYGEYKIKRLETELVSKRGELQYLSNVIDTKNKFVAIETHNQALALVMVDRNSDMYRFFKGGEDYVKKNMYRCRTNGGQIIVYVDHVPNPLKLYKQIVVNLFNFGIYEHNGSACRMPNVSHKFLRDTILYLFQQSRYACGL